MADIYDHFRLTGRRLLLKFGRDAVWRQFRESGGTPYQPTVAEIVDFDVRVAIFPNTKERRATIDEGDTEQRTGQLVAYMGSVPFIPSGKDVLVVDSIEHRIDNVRSYKPATKDCLHVVELYE